MKSQIIHLKTGTIIAVLLLFVTVISCNQDVTGSVDETIQSAQVTTLANVEVPCEPGFFSDTGNTPCEPAPVGRYVPESGATIAIDCPAGRYQDETGQTECKLAEPGSFVDFEGATSSSLCPTGTFSDQYGASRCIACQFGQTTDGPGATVCILIVNDPETKDDCKQGSWEEYGFKNQGQCIQFVNTGKDSR